jgi:hypothetical protein
MTDEPRPIRQNSGNLKKFQAATSELTNVAVKLGLQETFVEDWLGTLLRGRQMTSISGEETRVSGHETSGVSPPALASAFKHPQGPGQGMIFSFCSPILSG